MMARATLTEKELVLPLSVVSRADVGQLTRELEALESAVRRATASKDDKPLPTSRLLDDISAQNKLNLLQPADRAALKTFLAMISSKAPLLHFSFSSDPSPRFLAKLLTWLRTEIDDKVLLHIGLEPALGAGCVLRTTNRYFDFSLRQHFEKQGEMLLSTLREKAE